MFALIHNLYTIGIADGEKCLQKSQCIGVCESLTESIGKAYKTISDYFEGLREKENEDDVGMYTISTMTYPEKYEGSLICGYHDDIRVEIIIYKVYDK